VVNIKEEWEMKTRFVSFESGEGGGKSLQSEKIKNSLTEKGYKVIVLREPGGNPISEDIREIILTKKYGKNMHPRTEALLYAAARAEYINTQIQQILAEGECDIIISDRYIDSSLVYQGMGRDLGIDAVKDINHFGTHGLYPDKTFVLDVPVSIGLERAKNRGELNRMDDQKISFHETVREGYLRLADIYFDRIDVVDASRSIEEVHDDLLDRIMDLLNSTTPVKVYDKTKLLEGN